MIHVRSLVVVADDKSPRFGQSGVVETIDIEADEFSVRFDAPDSTGGEVAEFNSHDLRVLLL